MHSGLLARARERFGRGCLPEAAELCWTHLQTCPSDAEAHFLLAHCQLGLGNLDLALETFRGATRLAPNQPELWHDLGTCWLESGCQVEAARLGLEVSRVALRGLGVPCDLVLLLDVSEQATSRWSSLLDEVDRELDLLGPRDRLALVGFNHDLTGYRQGIFVTVEEGDEARRWLAGGPAGRADLTVLLERVACIGAEPGRLLEVIALVAGEVRTGPIELPFPLTVRALGAPLSPALARLAWDSQGVITP